VNADRPDAELWAELEEICREISEIGPGKNGVMLEKVGFNHLNI
jgi:hypothetical protein